MGKRLRWSAPVIGALLLASCGSGPIASQRIIERDTFAIVFDAGADHAAVEEAAREICAGKQWCKVLGWTDGSAAATSMPMTDRELAAQRFSLTINRASGMDEATWR